MSCLAQVRRFVECVYDPDDTVELRLVHGGRTMYSEVVASDLTTPETVARLADYNRRGYGIYSGSDPRRLCATSHNGWGRICFPCLYVDADKIPLAVLLQRVALAALPEPTLAVASGRVDGWHLWWRLQEPIISSYKWQRHQWGLIQTLDTDWIAQTPPFVLRVPGFANEKYPHQPPCEIVESDPSRRYPVGRFCHIEAVGPACSRAVWWARRV